MIILKESNLEPPPEQICCIKGVAGILLLQKGLIVISDMPFENSQVERISDLVREMCAGFQKVRRPLARVIIEYPFGTFLVQSRDESQLVLLLMDDPDLDAAAEAAREYLAKRVERPLRLPRPSAA
jgi:hypothetical protein